MPDKTKQVDLDNKTTTETPDLDPNASVTNQLPETTKLPETNSSDLKKLETDLADGNANKMDSDLDTPKDQEVANGEKPPKSDILEDDPNLKDKELDNFKKYEDDVEASTRKKMEDDAEVQKGPDHDSKVQALIMARVIVAANDKIDTPIPALMTELAPLKAMKGVDNFKAEGNGNGKFEIYLIASKIKVGTYTIRETTEEENKRIDEVRKRHNISKKKNIATFEGEIDGKPLDLVSYSGEDIRPGTVDPVDFDSQLLKTQPTKSDKLKTPDALDRRAYDSEAKGLENILRNTTPESTGNIILVSERNLCGSCTDVVEQFRKLRPEITIEVAYSIPYNNPLF